MSAPAPAAQFESESNAAAATSSGDKRTRDDDAAAATRRVQPRHFHFGPNPAVAATAIAAADARSQPPPPGPAARLYRHALESVFDFLGQGELALALRVSRGWLAAVQSMRRMELSRSSVSLDAVAQSVMGRHIGELNSVHLVGEEFFPVVDQLAHLRALRCTLYLPQVNGPVRFPAQLRLLDVYLIGYVGPVNLNAAIAAIAQLPLLEELTVHLPVMDPQLSFAPLIALPLLRRLDVDWPNGGPLTGTDAQVDELRALPRLQQLRVPTTLPLLRRLLRQPHNLQWQQISLPFPLDDEAAAVVPQLPSLTAVVHRRVVCDRFDWLARLPNLTEVQLSFGWLDGAVDRAESLVAGLQHCTNIEILDLARCQLTAVNLADLLPRLPRLWELRLGCLDIDSLSFLAQPPMTSQLCRLELLNCSQLILAELRHVHALRGLETLRLIKSFTALLDDYRQSLYTPPSLLLPLLEEFWYRAPVLPA